MEVHKLEESEEGVTVPVIVGSSEEAGTEASGMRASKISESRKGE